MCSKNASGLSRTGEPSGDERAARYDRIFGQLRDLVATAPSLTAAMATVCAVLHAKMPHHSWTGFYVVAGDELHVGPYQGPLACQVLRGGGVCLRAVERRQSVVVPDVSVFEGHIACDPRSRSEIVVPLVIGGSAIAVLDIDSHEVGRFSSADIAPLERIVSLLESLARR